MMASDETLIPVAVVAQTALAIAQKADKKADDAIAGWRSCYQALGQIREAVSHLEALIKNMQAEMGLHAFDTMRPPPPDEGNGEG